MTQFVLRVPAGRACLTSKRISLLCLRLDYLPHGLSHLFSDPLDIHGYEIHSFSKLYCLWHLLVMGVFFSFVEIAEISAPAGYLDLPASFSFFL